MNMPPNQHALDAANIAFPGEIEERRTALAHIIQQHAVNPALALVIKAKDEEIHELVKVLRVAVTDSRRGNPMHTPIWVLIARAILARYETESSDRAHYPVCMAAAGIFLIGVGVGFLAGRF